MSNKFEDALGKEIQKNIRKALPGMIEDISKKIEDEGEESPRKKKQASNKREMLDEFLGNEYTKTFGKLYGIAKNKNRLLENFASTTLENIGRVFVGENKRTLELLQKDAIRKTGLIERTLTGERYIRKIKPIENSDKPEEQSSIQPAATTTKNDNGEQPWHGMKASDALANPKFAKALGESISNSFKKAPNIGRSAEILKTQRLQLGKLDKLEKKTPDKKQQDKLIKEIQAGMNEELNKLPADLRAEVVKELDRMDFSNMDWSGLTNIIVPQQEKIKKNTEETAKEIKLLRRDQNQAERDRKRMAIEASRESKKTADALLRQKAGKFNSANDNSKKGGGFLETLGLDGGDLIGGALGGSAAILAKKLLDGVVKGLSAAKALVSAGAAKALKAGGTAARLLGKVGGSILGFAIDGIIGYFKAQDWGVSTLSAVLGSVIGGQESGIMNTFLNMGKWAVAGAAAGSVVPVVGTIAGGLIGAIIGGVLGWVGGDKIAQFIDSVPQIFSDMWSNVTTKFNSLIDGTVNKINELKTQLGDWVSGKITSFTTSVKEFMDKVFSFDFWKDKALSMFSVGKDAVKDAKIKIDEKFLALKTTVQEAGKEAIDFLKPQASKITDSAIDSRTSKINATSIEAIEKLINLEKTKAQNEERKMNRPASANVGISSSSVVNSGNKSYNVTPIPISPFNPERFKY